MGQAEFEFEPGKAGVSASDDHLATSEKLPQPSGGSPRSRLQNAPACPECSPVKVMEDDGAEPLVYIKYRDHVLFRYGKCNTLTPAIRETIGWVVKENDEAFWILWDKSAVKSEDLNLESGLIILKSDILEVRRVRVE